MAKYVLNNSSDDLDFVLIGLMSTDNQYELVSNINSSLNIQLELSDNVPFNLKAGNLFYFSLYRYLSEEFGFELYMIPNNSNFEDASSNKQTANDLFSDLNVEESTKLIKELPKTDYFIILKGEDLHLYQYKIIDKLKQIPEILQVQTIEARDLPSRMNLIF